MATLRCAHLWAISGRLCTASPFAAEKTRIADIDGKGDRNISIIRDTGNEKCPFIFRRVTVR